MAVPRGARESAEGWLGLGDGGTHVNARQDKSCMEVMRVHVG